MGIFCCISCNQILFNVSHWAFNVVANCCKSVMVCESSFPSSVLLKLCYSSNAVLCVYVVIKVWSRISGTSVGLESPWRPNFVELAKKKTHLLTCFRFDFQVCLPASVLEHIEPSECVFKLSSSVKTSRGVGKIAMTQRRLFLLTDGRPGYVEVAQYRDIEVWPQGFLRKALRMSFLRYLDPVCLSRLKEVKVSSAPFLVLRIPSLKLRVHGRKEAFEANLKTETDLWNLMVKEMWAGRNMADQHKVQRWQTGEHVAVVICQGEKTAWRHSVGRHVPRLLITHISVCVCLCQSL